MGKSKDKERRFEQQAKVILKYLKQKHRYGETFLPRPFFIEFTGSPSAGKTTTITELDKFLRRQGFRVLCPQEGAEVIRHIPRTTPLYNIRTGIYAITKLIDEGVNHQYDVVIFDRGAFDAYVWMMYWRDKNKLTEQEKQVIQSFFLSDYWINQIDIAYFMVCDSEFAMERELRIALSDKLGETTNPKTVESLVKRYREAHRKLHPRFPQLKLFNTTQLSEQKMVEGVAIEVLDAMERKAKSGH